LGQTGFGIHFQFMFLNSTKTYTGHIVYAVLSAMVKQEWYFCNCPWKQ